MNNNYELNSLTESRKQEFNMLLAHVLGYDGGGACD